VALSQWQIFLAGDKPAYLEWCAITEDTLVENFHRVFGGHPCKIFAKLLYIYLAYGQDCAQINYMRFLDGL
jgi:hypothetical protein